MSYHENYTFLLILILYIFCTSVSNIFGKNRNKGQNNNGNQINASNQWNSSPSSVPRRRSGPSVLPNEHEGKFHDGVSPANRKSPGIFISLFVVT